MSKTSEREAVRNAYAEMALHNDGTANGIGVDDAFHYLHRYREERAAGADSRAAIEAVHSSIGRAIYFTSITVVAGFSLLILSNFVPTVYFGLLTALAMVFALTANLLLLPALLLAFDRR